MTCCTNFGKIGLRNGPRNCLRRGTITYNCQAFNADFAILIGNQSPCHFQLILRQVLRLILFNLATSKPIIDVPTTWNSTWGMIEKAIYLRQVRCVLNHICTSIYVRSIKLS